MRQKLFAASILSLLIPIYSLGGCSSTQENEDSENVTNDTAEKGELSLVANGEDFIREGFVSKDGWSIDFNNVYVTLDKVTAYQTNPPFNAETDEKMEASEEVVLLDSPKTVDLAEGDEDADPILVVETEAPPGSYNALSWEIVPAETGPAAGKTILLEGKAEKEDRKINFSIGVNESVQYTCGEFVGEERKGILNAGDEADLETTFHFDHLFGDGEIAPDDAMNVGALGFDPLASLAENGAPSPKARSAKRIDLNMETLEERLSPEEYQKLKKALISLGHVGEGHCAEKGE